MCGIYGAIGGRRDFDEALASEMDHAIVHRGPDDNGVRFSNLGFMGMRRLSILDLTSGQQPIANERGDIWVVFNGEIYNYKELREELTRLGHRFRTQTDTEVIVHGYEAWGESVLNRLSGMFALAIFDERKHEVLLARDHMGKKPLYLWKHDGRVYFFSEIKSILQHPEFRRTIDPEAFWHFLTFKNVPAPMSIFQGVVQIPQGTFAKWNDGRTELRQYYRPRFTGDSPMSEDEAADSLLNLLRESVYSRMLTSDVPVGAYLSGGLDSSIVVALASECMDRPVETFSLGYAQAVSHKVDVAYARDVSKLFGTKHHELFLTSNDVIAGLPGVVESFDEPFGAGNTTYYLSRLISEHVTVALTGDGADELFGSYAAHRMATIVDHIRAGQDVSAEFSSFFGNAELAFACAREPDHEWRTRFAAFTDAEKRSFVTNSASFKTSADLLEPFYREASGDLVNRTLEVECRTLLPDQILTYVDRLSMAWSVETRSPFLDRKIVELASSLPGNFKVRPGHTKAVLKRAARKLLPDAIIDRPKEGFVLPIDVWLGTTLLPLLRKLSSDKFMAHGLMEPTAIARFIDEHVNGHKNHTYKLWTFMMFQLWFARYMVNCSLEELVFDSAAA